jgi:hypothetical protein
MTPSAHAPYGACDVLPDAIPRHAKIRGIRIDGHRNMRNTFCLLVLFASTFAAGQAVARKLEYAMPPTSASAEGLTCESAVPLSADGAALPIPRSVGSMI